MKDLKISKQETEKRVEEMKSPVEMDQYPWGMRLNLDSETIKKLGMEKLPEVGEFVEVRGLAKVVSKSVSDHMHGEHKSLELQLQQVEITPEDKREKDPAGNLYGKA